MKTIIANIKPFAITEAHYDDARFYLKDAYVKNALPIHGKQDGEQEQSMRKEKKRLFLKKK